jgi:predicted dinucleotide-binding enzyme
VTESSHAITIVGAGSVGVHLARAVARLGHAVTFAVRDPDSPGVQRALAEVPDASVVTLAEADPRADLTVLAVPAAAIPDVLETLVVGRILVDATNPIDVDLPDGAASVPDWIHQLTDGLTVVKAFNTIGAEQLTEPTLQGRPAFLPVAGPAPAVDVVRQLADDMGLDAHVIGDVDDIPMLEAHARLWIHLAVRRGMGRRLGFGLLREGG